MANFRSASDYVTSILQLAGEVTNGNSTYQSKAIEHLNSIHKTIIMGGNEFNIEVDEDWPWARAKKPMYIELLPAVTGTMSITKGSEAITFSAIPLDEDSNNVSLQDWFIKGDNSSTVYRINTHVAGETGAELDSNIVESTGSDTFTAFKLIYKLESTHLQIQANVNDRLYFAETDAKTLITSSITVGTYTPSELATEIQTQLNADGASTYIVAYDTALKKFTITSDGVGGDNVFWLISENALNASTIKKRSIMPTIGLGLRDLQGTTTTGNASKIESDIIFGSVARLIQPMRVHVARPIDSNYMEITKLDHIPFDREFSTYSSKEDNPTYYKVLDHTDEGELVIQINSYPESRRLLEIPYVPMPVDLFNNAASHPLCPSTMNKVLEYGAAAWLLFEKNDDKWQGYYKLAADKLQAIMASNRKTDQRTSLNFGEVVAREDLLPRRTRKLTYGYGAD
jgi:hypothetical protein